MRYDQPFSDVWEKKISLVAGVETRVVFKDANNRPIIVNQLMIRALVTPPPVSTNPVFYKEHANTNNSSAIGADSFPIVYVGETFVSIEGFVQDLRFKCADAVDIYIIAKGYVEMSGTTVT